MCEHQTPFGWCGFFLWGSKGAFMSENFKSDLRIADEAFGERFEKYQQIIKDNPYSISALNKYLGLETWVFKDGLLLLTGINPIGAEVEWNGYENYNGVWIDQPVIRNADFLDPNLPDYTTPTDFSYMEDKNHFKGDKDIEEKISLLKRLGDKLQYLLSNWESALTPHEDRNTPSYYIEWALSKGLEIPWLAYAIEYCAYKPKQLQEVESKPIANNDRAHVSNNLAILNQAATKFWANADPSDNTTHPINSIVTTWLIQRGYSATLADKGATIIRPEWATTGRKADK
jgi:hypothetical protein